MFSDLISSKIRTLEEAAQWRCSLKKKSQKLVMTNGCFDILHRGHVTYLMKARELGDALLLAVNSDRSVRSLKGDSRPVTKECDRAFILSCLMFIDAVVIFDTLRCDPVIDAIKPDIYVKGSDYNLQTMDQTERHVLEKAGSKIEFISFVDGFSTTSIIKKINTQVKPLQTLRIQPIIKVQNKSFTTEEHFEKLHIYKNFYHSGSYFYFPFSFFSLYPY